MLKILQSSFNSPENILYLIINAIIVLCVVSILIAVLIDFLEFQKRENTKKEKKSIVETGTMFLFFFIFYSLIRFGIGKIYLESFTIKIILISIGLLILCFGSFINIKGRFALGKNWSNQIKIYDDHTLVINYPYNFLRHPLYASLIWMFFAGSIIYLNYLAFLSNILIFIPFMYYRAKQEEVLLMKEFENYKTYKEKTGMFFPKL